jgi:hypothetical protein
MKGFPVALASVVALLAACKRDPPQPSLTEQEACEKLAALKGTTMTPADKDKCLAMWSSTGPNARACNDACMTKAKTYEDFDDCHDDCVGNVYPSFLVCQKLDTNGPAFDACTKKYDAVRASQPDAYKCWSRCGRRAKTGAEASACAATCKVL